MVIIMLYKIKKAFSVFITVTIILSMLPIISDVNAYEFNENGYTFFTNSNETIITGYNGNGGDIEIPSILGGYPVVGIAYMAFSHNTNITSVIIPNSVKNIAYGAFVDCEKLTSVVLLDNITSIGEYAFYNCEKLTDIVIPDSVTVIERSAFEGCASLTNVNVSENVIFLGENVYANCQSLTNINVSKTNPNYSDIDGILYDKDKTTLIQYPSGKPQKSYTIPNNTIKIGFRAFQECFNLTNILIPESVTYIDDGAFNICKNLENIVIPNSVTHLGRFAFYFNLNLTSVVLSENITSIEWYLFSNCRKLSSITIPKSVTDIGEIAFTECKNLTSIYFKGALPNGFTEENDLFAYGSGNLTLYCPVGDASWDDIEINGYPNVLKTQRFDPNKEILPKPSAPNKEIQPKPSAPKLRSKTHNSVTLQKAPNAQYRKGNGAWQTSPTFKGLTPNTRYNFQIRIKETATHNASPASNTFTTTTNRQQLATPKSLKLTTKRATWRNVKNNNGYILKILQGNKVVKTAQIRMNTTRFNVPKNLLKKRRSYKFTLVTKGKGRFSNSKIAQSKNIKF